MAPDTWRTTGRARDGWETRRNEIERLDVFFRKGGESLSPELPLHPQPAVRVYADLNTFRIALVPQSE
ncbi:hypothetical protein SGFS_049870 [Streptomyces graminofaciens]|uniref:Uncharacterized protein n=1 Tax=Streptomyces graminofaciens TaxID=68212 RepID=A0ABN5VKR4_9ACTN|nr:hypothetical protein SGFS_049870 [Streptomyces graminofaciens]